MHNVPAFYLYGFILISRKDDHLRKKEIKNTILFHIVNAEKNQELLEHVPHEVYLDLAFVFFYMADWERGRKKVFLFNNKQMREYGITKEELKQWSMENTPRLLPVSFHPMDDLLRGFQFEEHPSRRTKPLPVEQVPMYVLTNVKMFLGAACLFYPKVLSSIGNTLQSDFYILPSSIHECIILPSSDAYTKNELEEIVHEVNTSQVPEQEILSDHVYFYQNKTKKMSK